MQRTLSCYAFRLASGLCRSQPDSNICDAGAWIHPWSRAVVLKSFANTAFCSVYFIDTFVRHRYWAVIIFRYLTVCAAVFLHLSHISLFCFIEPFRSASAKWIVVFCLTGNFLKFPFKYEVVRIFRIFDQIIKLANHPARRHVPEVLRHILLFHASAPTGRFMPAIILLPS